MAKYFIEAMNRSGHWYVCGSDPVSGDAQHFMASQRRLFPRLPLRVVEHPSRRLVVLHDPREAA